MIARLAGQRQAIVDPDRAQHGPAKSTFLRQNALIVILAQNRIIRAQAAEARIGIVDRLFSRVGCRR